MDQANKIIKKYVDSGSYFEDAKLWYASKYLSPYTMRSIIFIIFVVALISAIKIYNLYQQEAGVKLYSFPLMAYDSVNYMANIEPISTKKEPINVSVARYLSKEYLKFREEYKPQVFKDVEKKEFLFSKIKALSSRKIFNEYMKYIDPLQNPDSPIIKYKNSVELSVRIDSIEFKGRLDFPESATIFYSLIEKGGDNQAISKRVANIDFTMLDLNETDKKSIQHLSFTVTNYKTYGL